MEIIFLGTNGWYDSDTGNTVCTLINSDRYHIILDAGNGISKIDQHIHDDLPVYLFLSHFHLDHIVGLHVLNKFRFAQGLKIFGQKRTRAILDTIINEPFTVPLQKLPYPVEVNELLPGPYKLPFALECEVSAPFFSHPGISPRSGRKDHCLLPRYRRLRECSSPGRGDRPPDN